VDKPDGAARSQKLGLHPLVPWHDFQHWCADADRLAGIPDNGGDHAGARISMARRASLLATFFLYRNVTIF